MIEIVGKKYGRLTVIKRVRKYDTDNKKQYCLAVCDCGKEKEFRVQNVTDGKTMSCGCLANEERERRRQVLKQAMKKKIPLSELHLNIGDCLLIYKAFDVFSAGVKLEVRNESNCSVITNREPDKFGIRQIFVFFDGHIELRATNHQAINYFLLQSILNKYKPC